MKTKMRRLSLTTALCVAGASPAFGQQPTTPTSGQPGEIAAPPSNPSTQNEEIVVTAQKTGPQTLQRTPVAISAFTAQQLQERQVVNVRDLAAYTPNLQIAQSTASAEIFIRGIGSTNVFAGSDPDVTVQIDGVYLARPSAQFADFFDVERVEVLRGPQGTLYGRNAAGGTLNVISRAPTNDFTGRLAVTGGNYGLFQLQGYVSGALIPDHLQASLSGNFIRHDGYIDNIVPGTHRIDTANRGGLRGQVRAEFGSVEATTRADWFKSDEFFESYDQLLAPVLGARPAPLANSTIDTYRRVALNLDQPLQTHGGGVSEDINVHLSNALTLKSLTAYRENYYAVTNDSDATELSSAINRQAEHQHQFSQEFNLQLNTRRFEAVAGVYYLTETIDGTIQSVIPPTSTERGTQPHVEATARAVFAQGTYHLTDQLSFTIGGRYTEEVKRITPYAYTRSTATGLLVGVPFTTQDRVDFHSFTPKFGLNFQATPHVLLYASATEGSKSGGFNYAARTLAALRFGAEDIWSYEAGIKTDWLNNRLRVNLTGFYYNYTGLQVQSLLSPGNAFVGNANSARVEGLELEILARPVAGLTFTSNFALLDTRYGSFTNAAVATGLIPYLAGNPRYNPATTFYDATGNRLSAAPRFSTLQAVQYELPTSFGAISARAEYSWQSRTYYDVTNLAILSQPGYGLLNLALGARTADSRYRVQVLLKNVTDEQYLVTAAAPGASPTGHAGPPRTLWVTFATQW